MPLWNEVWPGPAIRIGLPHGAAPLGGDSKVPKGYLPDWYLSVEVKAADFQAKRFYLTHVDTRGGPVTCTIPSTLTDGDEFVFNDFAGTWAADSFFILGNGHQFDGGDAGLIDRVVCDIPARFSVIYGNGLLWVR